METFLELANRMRNGLPLQRVTREGKLDYAAVQQFLSGKTDHVAMTIRMGALYIEAVEDLGTSIARCDRERMLTLCAMRQGLPDRYEIIDTDEINPVITRSIDSAALRVAEAYSGAAPEIKRVFEDLIVASKPRRDSQQSPEEIVLEMERGGAVGRRRE